MGMWKLVYYCEDVGSESLFSTTFMKRTRGYGFYHGNGIMRMMDRQKTFLAERGLVININLSFVSCHH